MRAAITPKKPKLPKAERPAPLPVPNRQEWRAIVRGCYDIQALRIQTGNRIAANFRAKIGQVPGQKLDDEDATAMLDIVMQDYSRLTDAVANTRSLQKLRPSEHGCQVISSPIEISLIRQYQALVETEEEQFKLLKGEVHRHPLWIKYLKNVQGCGETMTAILLSEYDIARQHYPSTMWAYAGLDVGPDGRGRSRRKEHLVERTYLDKEGNLQTRMGITFNPFLKTKLMGVLASSFLKCKSEPYAGIYYNYRHRLTNRPDLADDKFKARRHNMALRYTVKMFLRDLYVAWRTLEGLSVALPYHEAKLHITHHVPGIDAPEGEQHAD